MLMLFLRLQFWARRNIEEIHSAILIFATGLAGIIGRLDWALWFLAATCLLGIAYAFAMEIEKNGPYSRWTYNLSIHEAAHAVIAWHGGVTVTKAVIRLTNDKGGSGGFIWWCTWPNDRFRRASLASTSTLRLRITLASIAAERQLGLLLCLSCEDDFQKTLCSIQAIDRPRGIFGTRMFSTQRMLHDAFKDAQKEVDRHWDEIEQFAALLRERHTLNTHDIVRFFRSRQTLRYPKPHLRRASPKAATPSGMRAHRNPARRSNRRHWWTHS